MNATTIKNLEKLYDELEHLQGVLTENYITLKQRSKEIDVEWTNEKDEKVTVKESHLWDELYYSEKKRECNAGKYLLEKYPQVFELEDQAEAKLKEVRDYEKEKFGFVGNNMRFIDLLKLIDELVAFKVKK